MEVPATPEPSAPPSASPPEGFQPPGHAVISYSIHRSLVTPYIEPADFASSLRGSSLKYPSFVPAEPDHVQSVFLRTAVTSARWRFLAGIRWCGAWSVQSATGGRNMRMKLKRAMWGAADIGTRFEDQASAILGTTGPSLPADQLLGDQRSLSAAPWSFLAHTHDSIVCCGRDFQPVTAIVSVPKP